MNESQYKKHQAKDECYSENESSSTPRVLLLNHCDRDGVECVYCGHHVEDEDSEAINDDSLSSCSSSNSGGDDEASQVSSDGSCSVVIDRQPSFLYDVDINNSITEEDDENYLALLPGNVLGYIGSFLSINDLTAVSMTNKVLYRDKQEYHFRKSIFHLVREEKLPPESDFRSTIQPYRFLFHIRSDERSDETLQVNFSLVKHLKTGRNSSRQEGIESMLRRHAPRGIPLVIDCLSGFNRLCINIIQKQSSSSSDHKVIYRIDQSIPGMTLHLEGKIISQWNPGQLSYLLLLCAQRIGRFPRDDGRFYPSEDFVLRTLQERMKEHMQLSLQKQVGVIY